MKAIIYTLVRAFEFELAVPAEDIQKKSSRAASRRAAGARCRSSSGGTDARRLAGEEGWEGVVDCYLSSASFSSVPVSRASLFSVRST